MKRTIADLLQLIATHKMRPATEDDNPWFFGPGVYSVDLGDDLLMIGKDPESEDYVLFYQTIEGCLDYRVSFEKVLDELS